MDSSINIWNIGAAAAMNLSQNKNAVAGHLDSGLHRQLADFGPEFLCMSICVVPSIRVAKLPLHQHAPVCKDWTEFVAAWSLKCKNSSTQILQSSIAIHCHHKQHGPYEIFGHCDEDVGKNPTGKC